MESERREGTAGLNGGLSCKGAGAVHSGARRAQHAALPEAPPPSPRTAAVHSNSNTSIPQQEQPGLTSNFQPCPWAKRSYMRKSSQANKLASAPPAPARTCAARQGRAVRSGQLHTPATPEERG